MATEDNDSGPCVDHERRISGIENRMEAVRDRVSSLEKYSHDKSNWLNRHNLEINAVQLQANNMEQDLRRIEASISAIASKSDGSIKETNAAFTSAITALSTKYDAALKETTKAFTETTEKLTEQVAKLTTRVEVTWWKVSGMTGLLMVALIEGLKRLKI